MVYSHELLRHAHTPITQTVMNILQGHPWGVPNSHPGPSFHPKTLLGQPSGGIRIYPASSDPTSDDRHKIAFPIRRSYYITFPAFAPISPQLFSAMRPVGHVRYLSPNHLTTWYIILTPLPIFSYAFPAHIHYQVPNSHIGLSLHPKTLLGQPSGGIRIYPATSSPDPTQCTWWRFAN